MCSHSVHLPPSPVHAALLLGNLPSGGHAVLPPGDHVVLPPGDHVVLLHDDLAALPPGGHAVLCVGHAALPPVVDAALPPAYHDVLLLGGHTAGPLPSGGHITLAPLGALSVGAGRGLWGVTV